MSNRISHHSKDSRFNTALARGFEILECFTPEQEFLGNKEIAQRTGIPTATVSRMTFTLAALGYLTQSEQSEKFSLSPTVLTLALPMRRKVDLDLIARPLMMTLAQETKGVVGLGILDGLHMVVIDSVATNIALTRAMPAGDRAPLEYSAMGWAALAAMSERERDRAYQRLSNEVEQWSLRLNLITKAGTDIWTHGFCIATEAFRPGWNLVAVPFRHNGYLYAFNCGAPAHAVDVKVLQDDWGPRMVAMTSRLKRMIADNGLEA